MFAQIRDLLPLVLIPSAWIVTHFNILNYIGDNTIWVAHIVMLLFISAFLITGYKNMMHGVLKSWLVVLILGFFITLLGAIGFILDSTSLYYASLYGWMIIPSIGLGYTGYELRDYKYYIATTLGLIGVASSVLVSLNIGVLVVGLGQTIGIGRAVVQDL